MSITKSSQVAVKFIIEVSLSKTSFVADSSVGGHITHDFAKCKLFANQTTATKWLSNRGLELNSDYTVIKVVVARGGYIRVG